MDNLEEIDKFLETYHLPRLNHNEIKKLNRLTANKEIGSVIQNLPTNKSLEPDCFTGDVYQTVKNTIILKLLKKKKGRNSSKLIYEASITLILKPGKNATRKENYLVNTDAKILNKTLNSTGIHCDQVEMQGWFNSHIPVIVTCHRDKIKGKNHVIISIHRCRKSI